MNLSISRKGLLLVAFPLIFQVAFVSAAALLQRDLAAAVRIATHTKDVIAQVHDVRTTVSDAQAAVRGYAVTQDPAFLGPFHAAQRTLPVELAGLGDLVADNAGQTAAARAVRTRAEAVLDWQGDIERLVHNADAGEATRRIRSAQGESLMSEFRKETGKFLAEEERLNRERQDALDRSQTRFNGLLLIGGLIAVGSTLTLAYAFRRGIAGRFAALEANVRLLATGGSPPPALVGNDEIGRLDRAFREMAVELTRTLGEARDLYDNAPCGYHSVDANGTVLTANRTELRWLGYEAAEVIGRKKFSDFVAAGSKQNYDLGFARVRESGSTRDVELELVRKDGTTFPVLVSSSSVRDADGRYLRSRTMLMDLTERRRAEGAIQLLADLARSIPIGLLIYRLDGPGPSPTLSVRSANPEATRLLGMPLEEVAGRPVADVFPAIPDDQLRRYAAVAAGGPADDLGVFRYGDGRVAERWWAVQAFPLPDRSVGVAFQDVSDRERAETEVRRLNAELEGRVQERTAELKAANRELAHKNAENEMFVYSVSHDLRSPLVNLQGFSRELEKAAKGLAAVFADGSVPPGVRERGVALLDGKVAKSIGFILTAVLRLSGIIDAMLRLSRAGRVEYRWEVVDVVDVVDRVVGALQSTVAERGATVRVGELPPAWGDRTAVEQVFANLIGNALNYSDPSRPGEIEVGTVPSDADGMRTYFVRDNGLGIPEAHRAKIFLAFQRAHPGVGSGEGLGLAIVTRVLERHRGRVWVESNPGGGTIFYVALHAAPPPPAPPYVSASFPGGQG